jgi:outer membrane protein TolC
VLSSQVQLANAQDSLSQAQKEYDVAVAKLNNVIGLPLSSQPILKQELTYQKYPSSLEECQQYALTNRPEMAKYQAKVGSAESDVKIAQSGFSPAVDFSLSENWSDTEFPGANNNEWHASLTASMNLFDSGLNKSKVKQKEYSLDAVKEQARQQRDTILLEVREAYVSMREAEKRIDTKKVAIAQAEESLMIAETRYRLGVGTNLAVFGAVVALNTAKLNSNKALYDYNSGKAQLEKAMGIAAAAK